MVEKAKADSVKGNIRLMVWILGIWIFGFTALLLLGLWAVIPTLWVGILSIFLTISVIVLFTVLISNPSWK